MIKIQYLLPKDLVESPLWIVQDSISNKLYNYFSSNKKRIKFSHEKFEEKFDIYCKDNVEAYETINPLFIENLLQLLVQHGSRYELYLFGNEIYIKHNITRPMVQLSIFSSIFKNLSSPSCYLPLYEEVRHIIHIIDQLKLHHNDKTFFSNTKLG